jgi:hypothetical protein
VVSISRGLDGIGIGGLDLLRQGQHTHDNPCNHGEEGGIRCATAIHKSGLIVTHW